MFFNKRGEEKLSYAIIGIVAIVAIVGLVILYKEKVQPPQVSYLSGASDSGKDAVGQAAGANQVSMMGNVASTDPAGNSFEGIVSAATVVKTLGITLPPGTVVKIKLSPNAVLQRSTIPLTSITLEEVEQGAYFNTVAKAIKKGNVWELETNSVIFAPLVSLPPPPSVPPGHIILAVSASRVKSVNVPENSLVARIDFVSAAVGSSSVMIPMAYLKAFLDLLRGNGENPWLYSTIEIPVGADLRDKNNDPITLDDVANMVANMPTNTLNFVGWVEIDSQSKAIVASKLRFSGVAR